LFIKKIEQKREEENERKQKGVNTYYMLWIGAVVFIFWHQNQIKKDF